jgi:hypothetical protein
MAYRDVGLTQLTYHNLHRLIVLDKHIQIFVVTCKLNLYLIPPRSHLLPKK